ncbi:MAG: lysoplasmalogenase [Leptospiraceae bacterium]|jgi:uncharacterized membrane protein YhhN|nr:lysoplasmalogenase [Leptospiraceae bacterium]
MIKNTLLLTVGITGGILYIFLNHIFGSFLLDFLIKPLPIWCLAIYTYQKKNALLTVGLLFGSLGDIFLTNSEEVYFKLGLSSFLIGHIFYIIYFIKYFKFNFKGLLISLIILFASIGVSYWIIPNLQQDLKIPVLVYIFVITTMAITTNFYQYWNIYAVVGAVLFLISDSMIAINQFVQPFPYAQLGIMLFYYLGQWGIAYGGCRKIID